MEKLDLTIRNGIVATATETTRCDVGISGGNYGWSAMEASQPVRADRMIDRDVFQDDGVGFPRHDGVRSRQLKLTRNAHSLIGAVAKQADGAGRRDGFG